MEVMQMLVTVVTGLLCWSIVAIVLRTDEVLSLHAVVIGHHSYVGPNAHLQAIIAFRVHCRLHDAVIAVIAHQTPIAGILKASLGLQIIATEPEVLGVALRAKEIDGAIEVPGIGQIGQR